MTDQRRDSRFYDPPPPLRRRVVIWMALFVGGLLAVLGFAAIIHPRYPDLCQQVTSAIFPCDPIPFSSFVSYTLMIFGMLVWILGPVVWSLVGLRRGYKWEQSRTEPAEINLIILIGFIYMGIGIAVQVLR